MDFGADVPFLFLWQRLVLRFRQKRKNGNAQQKYKTYPHASGAEALQVTADIFRDAPHGKWRRCGRESPEIVAKTRSGASEAGWEKLGQINRVDSEN